MRLGTFMMPLHPPKRQPHETYIEDREAILLADKFGYVEALVGEHVTDLAENVTSCMMFLASVAHDTKQIVLGTGTINMPNSHPAAIAAQAAMLDHLLKGRFIMGISPGGLMSDAEVFGNYKKDRNAIFLESINMVLDIWEGEAPYNLQGQFFGVTTQNIAKLLGRGGPGNLFKLDQNEPDSSTTADTMTPRLVIAGTVSSVVEQILAFREKVGPFGTLYYPCHDWVDPKLAKRSMELMVEQVMPKVNAALKE